MNTKEASNKRFVSLVMLILALSPGGSAAKQQSAKVAPVKEAPAVRVVEGGKPVAEIIEGFRGLAPGDNGDNLVKQMGKPDEIKLSPPTENVCWKSKHIVGRVVNDSSPFVVLKMEKGFEADFQGLAPKFPRSSLYDVKKVFSALGEPDERTPAPAWKYLVWKDLHFSMRVLTDNGTIRLMIMSKGCKLKTQRGVSLDMPLASITEAYKDLPASGENTPNSSNWKAGNSNITLIYSDNGEPYKWMMESSDENL